jgi:hypothetical protein
MTEFVCPNCGAILTVTLKETVTRVTKTLDDIKILFPKDLEELVSFEDSEAYVIVKPRQYLGSENFAKIASIIREAKGEYISAGKESHFRVPKEA